MLEYVMTGLGTLTVILLGMQLRKGEALDGKIAELSKNMDEKMESFATKMDVSEEKTIEVMNRICHERQGHCSSLVTLAVTHAEERVALACRKIDEIKTDRKEAWGEQRRWNVGIEQRLK